MEEPESIPLLYCLNYGWHWEQGALFTLTTEKYYGILGYEILVDVLQIETGWRVVPYRIKEARVGPDMLGPATALIKLGKIQNGTYTLEIAMKDVVDRYRIHKTDTMFWVEQVSTAYGEVVDKREFAKHLDGFLLYFLRVPPVHVWENVIQRIMTFWDARGAARVRVRLSVPSCS